MWSNIKINKSTCDHYFSIYLFTGGILGAFITPLLPNRAIYVCTCLQFYSEIIIYMY